MRAIDADAVIEKCGDWYVEEGPEEGFIGTLKSLIDEQPTIQPDAPRVMTLEEALSADECWIEGRNGACGYGDALMTDDAERVDFYRPHRIDTLDFYAYGIEWHCWTSRPDVLTREATPWET